jgi:hypothetical protein
MLMGCSTKLITTSNGKFDMSQLPPVFSEKKDYKTVFVSDSDVTVGVITTVLIGVPIVVPTEEKGFIGMTAQDVLDKTIPMSIIHDANVTSTIRDSGDTVNVKKWFKEGSLAGLEVDITPNLKKIPGKEGELHPGVETIYTTYMEWKCEKTGCSLVRENMTEDEMSNKRITYVNRIMEDRGAMNQKR